MITSFFPGRIRLRSPVFKDTVIVEEAQRILSQFSAATDIQCNPRTGSVLLEYNPEEIPVEQFNSITDSLLSLHNLAKNYTPNQRNLVLEKLQELEPLLKKIIK